MVRCALRLAQTLGLEDCLAVFWLYPASGSKPAAGDSRRGTLSALGVYTSMGWNVGPTRIRHSATAGRLGNCETYAVTDTCFLLQVGIREDLGFTST